MPAEIVTLEDCASCFGVFSVEGSTGNTYEVAFQGESGVHCTCKGFEYRGDCKHVSETYRAACMFNPQHNKGKENPAIRPHDYTYQQFSDGKCPACGGPMVYVKRAV